MILIAVISLGAIGAVGAVFLYAASKKFEVYEDPRIAQVPSRGELWRLRLSGLRRIRRRLRKS